MQTRMRSPMIRSAVEAATGRLAYRFRGVFSRETVAQFVQDSYEQLGQRPNVAPQFLPIFIERFARERLEAMAQAQGLIAKQLPEVLFVCEHNSGRSQIAAAFTHELSSGRVAVRSAGSRPREQINPVVVEAMGELGIDIGMQFPKPLTTEVVQAADVVITLGCGDACPIYPGKRYEDWEVTDPADQPLEVVRQVRDEIRARVTTLLGELGIGARP